MIIADDNHVLFIEPTGERSVEPVEDDITHAMRKAFKKAKAWGAWLGVHRCTCGALSDSSDWLLPNGQLTNSLALHYLRYHRDEVPDSELAKVMALPMAPISATYANFSECEWGSTVGLSAEAQQVLAANTEFLTAMEQRDLLSFDRYVREDAVFVDGRMNRRDTKAKIRHREIEASDDLRYAINSIRANSTQVYEGTAVVTGRISVSSLSGTGIRDSVYAFTNVFIRDNSGWRLFSATTVQM